MPFVSIHGREFGYDQNNLYLHGRIVGNALSGRGRFFYVDSAVDGASGANPSEAVGTLDEAFALCEANRGDTIVVMPNHAETVTGAGGITHDVAGVSVIGLGTGQQRPRFLMDGGTTVTYLVSAADAYIENLVFAAGHASVVTCFALSTAQDCTLKNIEFEDNTTSEFFLVCVKATGAAGTASGLTIEGCKRVTAEAATDFLSLVDDIGRLTFRNNVYIADAATGAGMILCATGKVITGLVCERNTLVVGNTATDLFIDNDATTNTGYAAWNLIGSHDAAAAILFDCDGIRLFQNYHANTDTSSGLLLPAASIDT